MNTRHLAVKSLIAIFSSDEKPKDALEKISPGLDVRERAFLMELVYGVLRQRDLLDWLLAGYLKGMSRLPEETLNNLRVAMYQLHFTRVPEWAAVDEAVNIEKRKGGKSGLVNAVLRNYLRQKDAPARPYPKDTAGRISISESHPEWLVRRWIKRLGPEETESLARSNNEIPPLTIRVDCDRVQAVNALSENGIDAAASKYSPAGIIIRGRRTGPDDAVRADGESALSRVSLKDLPLDTASFVVQDEAAQLVSYLLGPQPGERVLDACAAPGGKTTHIARLMKDEGEVVAVEIDARRAAKISENVSRLGMGSVKVVIGDIRNNIVSGVFDRVLLDAPCSSIGVIRRNPDVKYRHREQDLARLGAIQLSLLEKAAMYLKKGGIMVYSVCSTEPEEGEEVIASFLQGHPDFSIIKEASGFPAPLASRDGLYRTWPHRHGMDGFFAVRLIKG